MADKKYVALRPASMPDGVPFLKEMDGHKYIYVKNGDEISCYEEIPSPSPEPTCPNCKAMREALTFCKEAILTTYTLYMPVDVAVRMLDQLIADTVLKGGK